MEGEGLLVDEYWIPIVIHICKPMASKHISYHRRENVEVADDLVSITNLIGRLVLTSCAFYRSKRK